MIFLSCVVLISISLINEFEYLFIYLGAICISFFVKCVFNPLPFLGGGGGLFNNHLVADVYNICPFVI